MIGAFGRPQVYWTIVSIESSGTDPQTRVYPIPSSNGTTSTYLMWRLKMAAGFGSCVLLSKCAYFTRSSFDASSRAL
jgi:hypothetical protein